MLQSSSIIWISNCLSASVKHNELRRRLRTSAVYHFPALHYNRKTLGPLQKSHDCLQRPSYTGTSSPLRWMCIGKRQQFGTNILTLLTVTSTKLWLNEKLHQNTDKDVTGKTKRVYNLCIITENKHTHYGTHSTEHSSACKHRERREDGGSQEGGREGGRAV